MAERRIRILLGRLGEGYKEAVLNLAEAFREAGFEVIFTELQEPEAIVSSAIQESVDHIGITILPGADIQAFQEIKRILGREKVDYITMTAGGFLEEKDVPQIKAMGVMEFFPRGTSWEALIEWSRKNITPKAD
ncbi:MAG: cobalamin-dependent protein [Desulfobacteraceae bacterium]|jgi:methylmalonyl-CoA mutase C-terminal domain/subunit